MTVGEDTDFPSFGKSSPFVANSRWERGAASINRRFIAVVTPFGQILLADWAAGKFRRHDGLDFGERIKPGERRRSATLSTKRRTCGACN
jgi:hypothetical protein